MTKENQIHIHRSLPHPNAASCDISSFNIIFFRKGSKASGRFVREEQEINIGSEKVKSHLGVAAFGLCERWLVVRSPEEERGTHRSLSQASPVRLYCQIIE